MFKKSIKSICMAVVGVTLLGGSMGSLQAKTTDSYSNTIVSRLEQVQGVKYGVSDNADYTYLFNSPYSVNIESKVLNSSDLGLKKVDSSKVTKTLIENELFFLKMAYDYVVDFGCSYEGEVFYTYSGSEVSLIDFDYYVYSLIKGYISQNGAEANEYAKRYAELLNIRECIFNFSYVSSEFRETTIEGLANIYWCRDAKFAQFIQ